MENKNILENVDFRECVLRTIYIREIVMNQSSLNVTKIKKTRTISVLKIESRGSGVDRYLIGPKGSTLDQNKFKGAVHKLR